MDTKWTPEIVADFEAWLKTHQIDEVHIDWHKEQDASEPASDEETLLG